MTGRSLPTPQGSVFHLRQVCWRFFLTWSPALYRGGGSPPRGSSPFSRDRVERVACLIHIRATVIWVCSLVPPAILHQDAPGPPLFLSPTSHPSRLSRSFFHAGLSTRLWLQNAEKIQGPPASSSHGVGLPDIMTFASSLSLSSFSFSGCPKSTGTAV